MRYVAASGAVLLYVFANHAAAAVPERFITSGRTQDSLDAFTQPAALNLSATQQRTLREFKVDEKALVDGSLKALGAGRATKE